MSALRVDSGTAKRTSGIDVTECYRQTAEYPDRISLAGRARTPMACCDNTSEGHRLVGVFASLSEQNGSSANLDAWRRYRQAFGAIALNGWNEESLAKAANHLHAAIAVDPNLALAHALVALWGAINANMSFAEDRFEAHQQALRDAEIAVSLDPNASELLGYAGCALSDIGEFARGRVAGARHRNCNRRGGGTTYSNPDSRSSRRSQFSRPRLSAGAHSRRGEAFCRWRCPHSEHVVSGTPVRLFGRG
jgi:tetratricopeptide (TPR) repeat protein